MLVTQYRPVAALSLLEDNPRQIQDADFRKLCASITAHPDYFEARPCILSDRTGKLVIIAGNMRYRAAMHLGLKEIPTVLMPGLTIEREREIVIRDNVSNGAWDWDALSSGDWPDAATLNDWGVNVPAEWGVVELPPAEEVEPDFSPPSEPITVLGDLYELNKHRLHCGDSASIDAIDVLLAGTNPDAVVTDPPYGIGIDGQKQVVTKNPKHQRKTHKFCGWDSKRPDEGIFNYIVALRVPAVIWGGNYFADLLPATRGWIYWSKGQDGLTMADGELAWTTEATALRCFTVNRGALQGSVHPTQKPLKVIEHSLDYIKAGPIVLDLFGGSGTTMIACEQSNRTARLMELDLTYCDVIVRRWLRYMSDNNRPASVKRNGTELTAQQLAEFTATT